MASEGVATAHRGALHRLAPPIALLPRVRWFLLVIALAGLITAVPLVLFSSSAVPTLRWAGVAGLVWMAWWWFHGYRVGGFSWQGDAACLVAVFVVVVGASDPANSQMVLLTGVAFRVISSLPKVAYRTAAGFASASLAGALATYVLGREPIVLGDMVALILAFLLVVVVIQILRSAILRQQQSLELATAVSRLQPAGSTEETAGAICTELLSLSGVDFSNVVVFSAEGIATVVAQGAPRRLPVSTGDRVPAARAAYLIEHAVAGPWTERWRQRPEDGEYGTAMTEANVQVVSYAPIRYGEITLGLLVAGSLRSENADALTENLPEIAEFGSTASALLVPGLRAERLLVQRRTQIREIITSDAFQPVFQPIVEVESGAVVGYEALTRFADGERPDAHFSAAWSVGLGAELELATLKRAVSVARQLPAGRWLSVNISPTIVEKPKQLRSVLDHARRSLVLEITEHEQITDYRSLRDALSQFAPALTAVDDAGAGVANFAHIVELNADFIKLDIGLVHGVSADPARQAMIVALRHFARATGCRLIAEGVETEAEARAIRSLGVDFGQGYWYGRPSTVETLLPALGDKTRSTQKLRRPEMVPVARG
jgi:EAL domain-containing protein (putative c-di-GMP-specific phosphodiesterase class I)